MAATRKLHAHTGMALAQRHLSVLISSKQAEFVDERSDIQRIIRPLPLLVANAAEGWAPESTPVEQKSVDEAAGAAIYVGLFGCVYSHPTVLEYRSARQNPHRELLIYIKDCAAREPALEAFLSTLMEGTTGHTVVRFRKWDEVRDRFADHLWAAIGRMIERLIRLGRPPVAMGGGGVLERKWQSERRTLLELGLPPRPEDALALASELERARDGWLKTR